VRSSRTSRQEILQKLSRVFRRDGYAGASLADLAGAVGLGKASLYQKFPDGKVQMGAEVLAEIGRAFETEVLAPVREPGPVDARFANMLACVRRFMRTESYLAYWIRFRSAKRVHFIGMRSPKPSSTGNKR